LKGVISIHICLVLYENLREVVSELVPGHTRQARQRTGTGTWQGTDP
jgi:hypothetical protein